LLEPRIGFVLSSVPAKAIPAGLAPYDADTGDNRSPAAPIAPSPSAPTPALDETRLRL
jgi:hypothetical protein